MHLVGVNMFTAPTIGWESRACLCQTVVSHAALQLPRPRESRACPCVSVVSQAAPRPVRRFRQVARCAAPAQTKSQTQLGFGFPFSAFSCTMVSMRDTPRHRPPGSIPQTVSSKLQAADSSEVKLNCLGGGGRRCSHGHAPGDAHWSPPSVSQLLVTAVTCAPHAQPRQARKDQLASLTAPTAVPTWVPPCDLAHVRANWLRRPDVRLTSEAPPACHHAHHCESPPGRLWIVVR